MPATDKTARPVTQKLTLSQPVETSSSPSKSPRERPLSTRQASAGPRPAAIEEHRRSSSSEWIDVDDKPKRRKKRRSSSSQDRSNTEPKSADRQSGQRSEGNTFGRFFPKLGQILESNEGASDSRPQSRTHSVTKRRGEQATGSRRRYQDDVGSPVYRRAVKQRGVGVQRRQESSFKVNPSLLSVLSGMTGNSERSSGSNSTITQKSYDRASSESPPLHRVRPKLERSTTEVSSTPSGWSGSQKPNVFDYMQPPSTVDLDDGTDDDDGSSVVSTAASNSSYQSSAEGSSEMPETPSSRSTFPSPTLMTTSSHVEPRKQRDGRYAASVGSSRGSSQSPAMRACRTHPPGSDNGSEADQHSIFTGYGDESSVAPTIDSDAGHMSTYAAAHTSHDGNHERWQTIGYPNQASPNAHVIHPTYGQHRSTSSSTQSSEYQAWAQQMALQQYHHPSPPAVPLQMVQSQPSNNLQPDHLARRPSVPAAPDLTRRTIVGYEKLATELASAETQVKPLYRKFEYLNHRVLLHLQDELCELEEQLRVVDEIIAQLSPLSTDSGMAVTASRRGDAVHGAEIHHQRTALLGKIFVKTEQYNRAMSAYTALCRGAVGAADDQIGTYRKWMDDHKPIHEMETKFLDHKQDLTLPGQKSPPPEFADEKPAPTTPAAPPQQDWRLYLALVFMIGILSGLLMRG